MERIDELLLKHFQGEASPEEKELIDRYQKDNAAEYLLYKQLWDSEERISVMDFDSKTAWERVKKEARRQKSSSSSFRLIFRRIAAAVLFLIATATFYLIYDGISHRDVYEAATVDQRAKIIQLKDGSKVYLNKHARLTYPANFKKNVRSVVLEGEAFFEVAPDPDKPFIVHTQHSDIRVLGTSFNVSSNQNKSEISVRTGKVGVKSLYSGESLEVLPSFSAKVNETAIRSFETTNRNYLSWKTGEFHFNECSLEMVVRDLNSYYEIPVVLRNDYPDCTFTGDFSQEKLEDIIEILALSCKLTVNLREGSYEIY